MGLNEGVIDMLKLTPTTETDLDPSQVQLDPVLFGQREHICKVANQLHQVILSGVSLAGLFLTILSNLSNLSLNPCLASKVLISSSIQVFITDFRVLLTDLLDRLRYQLSQYERPNEQAI